jgi:hypothetical protein
MQAKGNFRGRKVGFFINDKFLGLIITIIDLEINE